MIPEETLEELRQDCLEVFENYLPHHHRATGRGNHSTRCPLGTHEDAAASFSFNPDVGMWNCFACGAKGDVFKLVMELDGVGFAKSVVEVARISGKTVDLGGKRRFSGVENAKKARIRENRRKICVGLRSWHRKWAIHWSTEVRELTVAVNRTRETVEMAKSRFEDTDHWLRHETARNHARAQAHLLEAWYLAEEFAKVGHDIGQIGRLFAEHHAKAVI